MNDSNKLDRVRRRIYAAILGAALAIVLVLGGTFLLGPKRLPEITAESVNDAIERWNANHPDSYDSVIEVIGPTPGMYQLNVRNGVPENLSYNGQPISNLRTKNIWTGRGMLRMLEIDLRNQRQAEEDGYRLSLKAEFDPTYGYPSEFQRYDFRARSGMTWIVREFSPRPSTDGGNVE